jgi:hypothetical protein
MLALACVFLPVKHPFLEIFEIGVLEVSLDCLRRLAVLKLARHHLDFTLGILIVFLDSVLEHLNDSKDVEACIFLAVAEDLLFTTRLHIVLHHEVDL